MEKTLSKNKDGETLIDEIQRIKKEEFKRVYANFQKNNLLDQKVQN